MQCDWIEVARAQAGVISSWQLLGCGLSAAKVRSLVASQALRRVARGVYVVVGSGSGWRCELWVALLSGGPSAFACRRSAAALWGLDGVAPGFVDVGVGTGHHPRRKGIVRLGSVDPFDVVRVDGVPTTSPGRTLLDLGAVVSADVVERSLECALRRRLLTLDSIEVPGSLGRSPGSGVLRAVLDRRPRGARPTESDAETIFVQIVRELALPDPSRQHLVILGGRKYRLDFAWPRLRLAVEIDGTETHAGSDALNRDLRRQNQIVLDGWMIVRFTWQMVTFDGPGVSRDVLQAWQLRSLVV